MARNNTSLGVDWHLPDGKGSYQRRKFATTTVATSTLLEALAEQGHTVRSARSAVLFDDEAKTVLVRFIDAGYGERLLADLLTPGRLFLGGGSPE